MRHRDWWSRVAFAADEGGGGGGGDGGDPGAGDGAAAKWFEDATYAGDREWLTAKGLDKVDDVGKALRSTVQGYRNAEQRLGRPADAIMDRPAKDQALPDWMRANAAVFGVPDSAEKYAIEKPTLPKGVEWDGTLEAEARKIAFDHALPPGALQAMVKLYADRITSIVGDADTQLATANREMMTALERDWGAQTEAKIGMARTAMAAIAEKAGLPPEAQAAIAMSLKQSTGDAGVMKLFAAIGEMIPEDTLAGLGKGAGGGIGGTPEEARRKLAEMDKPEGEWGKAFLAGNMREMQRLRPMRDALVKIAAGG